jgi:hypothetical protein
MRRVYSPVTSSAISRRPPSSLPPPPRPARTPSARCVLRGSRERWHTSTAIPGELRSTVSPLLPTAAARPCHRGGNAGDASTHPLILFAIGLIPRSLPAPERRQENSTDCRATRPWIIHAFLKGEARRCAQKKRHSHSKPKRRATKSERCWPAPSGNLVYFQQRGPGCAADAADAGGVGAGCERDEERGVLARGTAKREGARGRRRRGNGGVAGPVVV